MKTIKCYLRLWHISILLWSFSVLSQNNSYFEPQTWVFVGIVKNQTTDIHQKFYTDWEQITYYLQDLPIQLKNDKVYLGDICSFKFSSIGSTSEFVNKAYIAGLQKKIDIELDKPIIKLSIKRDESDCLPLYNDLFDQIYLIDDKLIIEYPNAFFVYEHWEYVDIPNDRKKPIDILPPNYPYLCEDLYFRDCSESKPIKRLLEKVFYIPHTNRIYVVLYEPETDTPVKKDAKYIVGTYDEQHSFIVNAIFIPHGFDMKFHMERDTFVADIYSKDKTLVNQWKYQENITFSHELYLKDWITSNIMEIELEKDTKDFCQSLAWHPDSYSWETHCVSQKTLNEVYTKFIDEEKTVNFLKQITPNVNYRYDCTVREGCMEIEYLWRNKNELTLSVYWPGGQDEYIFKEINGQTYFIKVQSAD